MITLQEKDRLAQAVKAHFEYVWPLVVAGREDRTAIIAADVYLAQVEQHSPVEHEVVMRMISRVTGLSWAAIRDAR